MISTKPPKEYLQAKEVKAKESASKPGKDSSEEEAWGGEFSFKAKIDDDKVHSETMSNSILSNFTSSHNIVFNYPQLIFQDDGLDEGDEDDGVDEEDPKSQQIAEPPEYKRLISIHAGKGKGGMQDWLKVDPEKVRRLSLSEQELEKAVLTYGRDIIRYQFKPILKFVLSMILDLLTFGGIYSKNIFILWNLDFGCCFP